MDLTGKLLVALPMLAESVFERTVILLLTHGDDEGAVGVILNRPSATALVEPLPRWESLAAQPAVVFYGGPVQPEVAIGLGIDGDHLGTVDLDEDPALAAVREVRVFAGYAGWAPGQLEGEIASGSWVVVDSHADDAFRADADDLWYTVLRRQPEPLRRLAFLPDDLSVN